MKQLSRVLLLTVGLILVIQPQVDAGQAIELNKQVQDGLIAAKSVRGPGVDRELFNGKPVLVVFFASW
ncbi:MAG: hypothetical protein GKS00_09020 [Alphaproteobacteria bacterium]|nr:hypothetical protein [Alphaproteobacteria bacterium]